MKQKIEVEIPKWIKKLMLESKCLKKSRFYYFFMLDEQSASNFFKQVMGTWILPRIKDLQENGKLSKPFNLRAAQIVFSPNSPKVHVRLNSQVKCIVEVKALETIHKYSPVYEHQIEDIKSFKIPRNKRNNNSGIVTLLKINNKWKIHFDFRYNKEKISKHLDAAKEFYDTAKWALSKNKYRPFFENSFGAMELATHALLLILPHRIIKKRTHEATLKALQGWSELGNVDKKYFLTLQKLNSMRASARYMASGSYKKENYKEILSDVEYLINFAQNQIK